MIPLTPSRRGALACLLLALAAPLLRGQETPPAPSPQEESAPPVIKTERLAIGLRMRSFPFGQFSVMNDKRSATTLGSAQAPRDWTFNTRSDSFPLGYGGAVELGLTQQWRVRAELLYFGLRYKKVIDSYWGTDDSATSNDERSHTQSSEQTRARIWDIPVMLQYGGGGTGGLFSHLYVAGGVASRIAARVRSNTEITAQDGTKTTSLVNAVPTRRKMMGATISIGLRFIDEMNIKVTPEIRFTRWQGSTFSSDSTQSPRNQIEFGIGFTR